MKKNYIIVALLIFAVAANLNAQFRELQDKTPVFHITFGDDEVYGTPYYPGATRLITYGTDRATWISWDSTLIEGDTVSGHAWAGEGTWEVFDFQEQVVNSDNFEEVFGPTMFWPSWKSEPDRADGIAAYDGPSGAYPGPAYDNARTIAFYTLFTDTAYVDSELGRDGGAMRLYDVGKWNLEGGGGMVRWYIDPANMQFRFDWGGAADYSEENIFPKGEWTHLALTIPQGGARADVKLYVNGIEKSFVADSASGDMTNLYTTPTAAWDGIRVCNLNNTWMADYRVYDAELTQTEVRELLGLFPLSTQSIEKQEMFHIYPVPNNGIFTVETEAPGANKVVIRNTLGQIVHNQIVDQKERINVTNLPTGLYFISVSDNQKNTQTQKFIIE